MSSEAISLTVAAALAAGSGAAVGQQLGPVAALGISAAFGIVGGMLSALIAAGDASISIRRVAICALTTACLAPAATFGTLALLYDSSHQMIPVVCASGVAGVATWPITDKLLIAFNGVSARAFGQWLLETARKLLGAR